MAEEVLLTFLSKEVNIHRIQEGLVIIQGENVIDIRNKHNLAVLKQYVEDILGQDNEL